jgi:hypothetical protein
VLFTQDVSRTNPFDDAYAAPGGPNDGPSRSIGAAIPPPDMTKPRGRGCDPLIDATCARVESGRKTRDVGHAESDPDAMRHAPKQHTELRPAGSAVTAAVRGTESDPYSDTGRAALAARSEMLAWRRAASDHRALGYNPGKARNMLPFDKTGPTVGVQAMNDPMPSLPGTGVPRGAPAALAGPHVSARQLELDPYGRAAAALTVVEDGRGHDGTSRTGAPPSRSQERRLRRDHLSTSTGGGADGGEDDVTATSSTSAAMGGRTRSARAPMRGAGRRARRDALGASDPDSPKLRQPRADSTAETEDPPVSKVAPMSDPNPNPREAGRVPMPAYLRYPRARDGFNAPGPLSDKDGADGVAPPESVVVPTAVTADAPGLSQPAGPVLTTAPPTDRMAFDHDFFSDGLLPSNPAEVAAAQEQAKRDALLKATDVGALEGERGFDQ